MKNSIWHSKLLVPNLYHTWLGPLKINVCMEKIIYPSISVGWRKYHRKCPYCLFALKKLQRQWVTLVATRSRKLQVLLKKRVVFSVTFMVILFKGWGGTRGRAVYLYVLTDLHCRDPFEHTTFWKLCPGLTVCCLYNSSCDVAKLVAQSLPVNLIVWKAGCMKRLSEDRPSKTLGQAKFFVLEIAVATRTADVCTPDEQHWW